MCDESQGTVKLRLRLVGVRNGGKRMEQNEIREQRLEVVGTPIFQNLAALDGEAGITPLPSPPKEKKIQWPPGKVLTGNGRTRVRRRHSHDQVPLPPLETDPPCQMQCACTYTFLQVTRVSQVSSPHL